MVRAQATLLDNILPDARGPIRTDRLPACQYNELTGWLYQDAGDAANAMLYSGRAMDYAQAMDDPMPTAYLMATWETPTERSALRQLGCVRRRRLVACAIAIEVAGAYPVMQLPPITISCSHEHAAWRGTVSVSARTLHPLIEDIADSLRRSGVERVCRVRF